MWNSQYEKEMQSLKYQVIDNVHSFGRQLIVPLTHSDENTNLQEIYMDGQELKTGEKKDEGKPRWELLDYTAVEGIVKVLTLGAKKYAARNWELGIHYGRVFGAVQRHLSAWWMGESIDSETGLSHLDHALTELMFLSAYEKRGMRQFDDRPNSVTNKDIRQG